MLNMDLKYYWSLVVNNLTTNGGRMSATEIVSAVLQNVFSHVFRALRETGDEPGGVKRKIFCKVADDSDGILYNAYYTTDGNTLGDDWVFFWPGTQRDTANDITGSERIYGGGLSTTTLTAGVSQTVSVDVKDATRMVDVFQADSAGGDLVRITNKVTPDSLTGTEQIVTIDTIDSVVGSIVTFTFLEALTDSYAIGAKVSSIYEAGDIQTSVTSFVDTTAGDGAYDDVTYPVVLDNIGTTDEDITLTFTDSTHFTAVGDSLGALGSGVIGTDFVVTNSSFSKPRFTLLTAGFSGTWAAGDTITFSIHPSSVPIWEQKVTPAGASSISNNKVTLISSGEAV